MSDSANVVRFRPRAAASAPQHPPRHLMEAVYAAGSLAVAADDLATKMAASLLQALGFFVIEEVMPDGSLRPLDRRAARFVSAQHPWRVSKPPFGGREHGLPDADGAFAAKPMR